MAVDGTCRSVDSLRFAFDHCRSDPAYDRKAIPGAGPPASHFDGRPAAATSDCDESRRSLVVSSFLVRFNATSRKIIRETQYFWSWLRRVRLRSMLCERGTHRYRR